MPQNPSAQGADNSPSLRDSTAENPPPLILPHQQKAFDLLCELTQIAIYAQRQCFPIQPRVNSLVIGPTGSGKTSLVYRVSKALNIPLLVVSISEWVLLGCSLRGAEVTWTAIVDFLAKHKTADGVIIAIDEIDKLRYRDNTWETFLLTEAYSLFDLRIPDNLRDDEAGSGSTKIEEAQEVLRSRTMLVGIGAFQEIWDDRMISAIGFHKPQQSLDLPSLKVLAEAIPPELANRFRSEVIILPPLTETDYHLMLNRCAEDIPRNFRERFLTMGRDAIPLAFSNRKGPRFLEELLVDLLIAERREIRMAPPRLNSGEENSPPI